MRITFVLTVSMGDNADNPSKLVWRNYRKTIDFPMPPRIGERMVVAGHSAVVCPRVKDVEWSMLNYPNHPCLLDPPQDVIVWLDMSRSVISVELAAIEESGFEVFVS
jgi:hypothetical protein